MFRRKTNKYRRESKKQKARVWNGKEINESSKYTDTEILYDALFIFGEDYDMIHQQIFDKD